MQNDTISHAYNVIVAFFQGGGLHMYPIALTMAIGFAIAIERWLFLNETRSSNEEAWEKLLPLVSQGLYVQATAAANSSQAAIARMLSQALSRLNTNPTRQEIEIAMEEVLVETLPRIEKRTHYLHTLANVAMLFGLLGTIMGLITGFQAIATVDPTQKAHMLSASFSVAMNATAFGLMAAIPLLLIHSVLTTRAAEVVESLETAAIKFLNIVTQPQQPAPQAMPRIVPQK
jgi:biopolymer transport protein ExbB/TolQ